MNLYPGSEMKDSHDQQSQEPDSTRQPLSRRAFLSGATAFGGALILAACGATPPAAEAPTAAPAAEAPTAAPAAEAPTAAPAAEAPTAAPAAEAPTAAPAAEAPAATGG